MENYILETLEATLNQKFDKDLTKYWEEDSFWKLVAENFYPDENVEDFECYADMCFDLIGKNFKRFRVVENSKHIAYVYISEDTNHKDTEAYALNQVDKSMEELQEYKIFDVKVVIDRYLPWTGEDKSSVRICYANELSPKRGNTTEKVLERDELSEKQFEAKFRKEFDKTKGYALEESETWADVYEIFHVAYNPKDELKCGAHVDAIPRSKKEKTVKQYGFITRAVYNTKDVPIEIDVKSFTDSSVETWIWHGSASKGSWIQKDQYEKIKSEGGTTRKLFYKGLELNKKVCKLKVE